MTAVYNGDYGLIHSGITDLPTSLSQLLQLTQDLTTTEYLYGQQRLAADDGSARSWYVSDALGSVRQTLDDSGAVLGSVTYDPWGTVESGSVPRFGFTGELQDESGMVYLRARWYNSMHGAFVGRDPFAGFAERPYSLNPYQYAYANPVLWMDPSGRCSIAGQGDDYCQPTNHRDPTSWLYREMQWVPHSALTDIIKRFNDEGNADLKRMLDDLNAGKSWQEAKKYLGSMFTMYGSGASMFYFSVSDKAPMDFKHTILKRLGRGITLCSSAGCHTDIEFSVPSNIFFGWMARAVGYADIITQAGAGIAHIYDPISNPDNIAQGKPFKEYDGTTGITITPWGPSINLGDEQSDNLAVSFGMYLYRAYGPGMTEDTFRRELTRAMPLLDRDAPDPNPVPDDIACLWPYERGYFAPERP